MSNAESRHCCCTAQGSRQGTIGHDSSLEGESPRTLSSASSCPAPQGPAVRQKLQQPVRALSGMHAHRRDRTSSSLS